MRTVVVVGATSGIGRRVAERLSVDGCRLVLVGRDPARAAELARKLPDATVVVADVSLRAGVALGAMIPAGGRIVNVNSEGHRSPMRGGTVRIDPERLMDGRGEFDPFLTYSRSKLANLLFTYELQRRRPDWNVVAVHPGVVRTDLGRQFPRLQVAAISAFALPARKGAEPIVELAVGAEPPTGYYDRFTRTRSSPSSYDTELAGRVWTATETLGGVRILDNGQ